MIRKSLFWGLTLVLIVAIVNLVLRGRRLEKQQSAKAAEVVQQSKPTSTRVLAPQDLEITGSTMQVESGSARHSIEIRNKGAVTYNGIRLKFAYLDSKDMVIAEKYYSAARAVAPGASIKLDDIKIDGIPASAARAQVSIRNADL
jgi:hypothetical protein